MNLSLQRFERFFRGVEDMYVGVPTVQVFLLTGARRSPRLSRILTQFRQEFGWEAEYRRQMLGEGLSHFMCVTNANKLVANVGQFPLVAVWDVDQGGNHMGELKFKTSSGLTPVLEGLDEELHADVDFAFGHITTGTDLQTPPFITIPEVRGSVANDDVVPAGNPLVVSPDTAASIEDDDVIDISGEVDVLDPSSQDD